MSSDENDRPTAAPSEKITKDTIRHTVDLSASDERRLRELMEIFDSSNGAETLRVALRIAHAEAKFIHAKKGNRIVMQTADGAGQILLPLELLTVTAES